MIQENEFEHDLLHRKSTRTQNNNQAVSLQNSFIYYCKRHGLLVHWPNSIYFCSMFFYVWPKPWSNVWSSLTSAQIRSQCTPRLKHSRFSSHDAHVKETRNHFLLSFIKWKYFKLFHSKQNLSLIVFLAFVLPMFKYLGGNHLKSLFQIKV